MNVKIAFLICDNLLFKKKNILNCVCVCVCVCVGAQEQHVKEEISVISSQ